MITNEELSQTFVNSRIRAYLYKKMEGIDHSEVDTRIEELLKYLNLGEFADGECPISSDVDRVWRYWVLETKEYAELCTKLTSGNFVHHSSSEYAATDGCELGREKTNFKRSLDILLRYVQMYGDWQQERLKYWPVASLLCNEFGGDVSKLNAWLKSKLRQQEATVQACI